MLLGAGTQILGGDVDDAVGVDIEGHLDLRHTAASRSDTVQMEAAQALVGSGHLTLTLQHVDLHGGLVVGGGGEDLALLDGDGGVALDQTGADAAHGLDAQRQGGDIQQQQTLDVAGQHAGLQGGALATHSSGLMPLKGSEPVKFFTASTTAGIRLEPPTISTLARSEGFRPASDMA